MTQGRHSSDSKPNRYRRQEYAQRPHDRAQAPHVSDQGYGGAPRPSHGGSAPSPTPDFRNEPAPSLSQYSADHYTGKANRRRKSVSIRKEKPRPKHLFLKIVGGLLALLVALFAAALIFVNVISSSMNTNDPELSAALDQVDGQDAYYTLLLGSDARKNQMESEARTDVIILARVDPKTATATLVSIPRDTLVNIEGYGANKINASYSYGGAAGAVNAVEDLMGVSISHYAEVSFTELESLVDAMGGVDVNVTEAINDPKAGNVTIDAGQQTLNGEQALVFARSRAYTNGDYTRGNNQKILVNAIVKKMLSLDAAAMPGVLMKCADCVSTDYNFTDLLALAMTFQQANNGGKATGITINNPLDCFGVLFGAITGSNGIDVTTALQLIWDFIMNGPSSGEDAPTEVTMYSATVPSAAQTIDGVSYVLADTTALKNMMSLVEAGEDPKKTTINSEEASWLGDGYVVDDTYVPSYDTSPLYGSSSTGTYDSGTGYDGGYDSGTGYDESTDSGTGYSQAYDDGTGYDEGTGGQ